MTVDPSAPFRCSHSGISLSILPKLFLREERLASSQFTKKPIILGLYCWLELVGVELGSSTFCALALLTTKGFTFNWVFGTLGAPLKGGLGLASFKIGIPGKFMILKTVK